jgi:hypothetical protein
MQARALQETYDLERIKKFRDTPMKGFHSRGASIILALSQQVNMSLMKIEPE